MDSSRNEISYKNRNNSGEIKENKKLSDNLPTDSGKQKISKLNRYSLFVKNLAKSKKFKSMEKRRKKESVDEQEKKKQKKPTYSEKFRRSSKPKVTFQSTSKNPKINEILKKLRESEASGNMTGKDNTINVGKIDSNKINKFLKFKDNRVNTDGLENNFNESKVKNYVEQLNKKILFERTSSENSKKKKVAKIKKNLKEKEFKELDEENLLSSSEDEYKGIRKSSKKYSDNSQQQSLQEEHSNNFYIPKQDQEKYLNQKSNINYFKFAFNSYTIKDKSYKKRRKSNPFEFMAKNQINFSILSQTPIPISKQKRKSIAYPKTNKSIKIKVKSKKTSADLNETEGNDKVKLYDIVGYDNKKRRMSIYDILKKRKISIISEDRFSGNRSRNSRSIKLVDRDRFKNIETIEEKQEKPEIVQYNDMVKYIVYTSVATIKKKEKFILKDLVMAKVADIALISVDKSSEIKDEERNGNNYMIIEKKNDIEIVGNRKKNSNSIKRNKNSLHNKEGKNVINNSSLNNKRNNKQETNLRISIKSDNKAKMNNTLLINKQTLQSIKRENKSTERRHLKSFLLFDNHNSSDEEEEKVQEKEPEKEIDSKNEIKQITNSKKLNQFDELFHSYATNYKKQNLPRKISKSMAEEESTNRTSISKKNNVIRNMNRQSIFTDKETNESRALFKKKLLTSNKLLNDEMDLSKKKIYKIKTNKAKIKKFISKKNLTEKQPSIVGKRKNVNLNNKKYIEKNAKIRQFPKKRNINSDYINNSNIILQNTTVNHTTYNYYLNEQDKSTTSKKNNSYKKKK